MSEEATLDDFVDSIDADDEELERPENRFWGQVPTDWELVDGSDVYEVNPNPKPEEEPNTYIEMGALDTELPWPRYFGERNTSEYSGKTFSAGDTLFARITPCTENGKAALVPEMKTSVGIGSTEYAVLSPKQEKIIPWYLYYVSKSHPVHDYAISRMRGSTGRQRVPFSVFRRELNIGLPPLEEQRKIASVLYNIDTLIKKTRQYISKLYDVKSGLLKHLLSNGYYNHEQWQTINNKNALVMAKSSKLPASWEIQEAEEVSEIKTGHTPSRSKEEYWGGDIPWIDVEDIRNVDGNVIKSTDEMITESGLKNSGAKLLPKGTLISCRMRAIGVSAILGESMTTNQDFVSFECDRNVISPEYLLYLLEFATPQLSRLTVGSTHPKIQLSFYPILKIPLPSIAEQKKIVDVISSVENKILKEKEYVHRINSLKAGVLQDLLTGKIRTNDTSIEVPKEITKYG
ncbi:restriction endonuclease subunit S [Halorubrum sp. ASP121]|uniref:restriction endonuclease subunit S n=1 Tax=Halorubrum sp. ASP121 TaxID=1855858 RepID=UPI0010F564FC|nr:restriction endonuclease subunit S [Halorubrum sp. ASP121]TKX51649.1 restriction endonuclease subunit S [Halorubrum sp. ASP121]